MAKAITFMVILLVSLFSFPSYARTIKLAILDSGLDLKDKRFQHLLCKDIPSRDYTGEGMQDTINHGTNVVYLINKYAKNSDYCIVIYKIYSAKATGKQNLDRLILAFMDIYHNKFDVANYSGGGLEFSEDEYSVIKHSENTMFFFAAGNEGVSLDPPNPGYYPACYHLPNIRAVGSWAKPGQRAASSNYGSKIDIWEVGERLISYGVDGKINTISGTSFATAVVTGKYINELSRKRL